MKLISVLFCAIFFISSISMAQINVIGSTGPVGIGTTPTTGVYLHIKRNVSGNYNPLLMLQDSLAGGFTQMALKSTGRTFHIGVGNTGTGFGLSDRFFIWDQNANLPRFVIDGNGSVGIGTTDIGSTYKLSVQGAIRARKIQVDQSTWPDYVFNETYELLPLKDVEKFIQDNNHLPNVPSAKEIIEHGVDLGETSAILLRKIEELTLYIIEQNKLLERQQLEINAIRIANN